MKYINSKNNKRPNVCINETYLKNHKAVKTTKKIVPGNRSYAETTTHGRKILFIGDSHVNPILGYMNIYSIRNKIISLREMVNKAPIDILCIDETKIDESFPDSQFLIENYQFPPYRRDRNSKRGGKIVYVRQGLISKRLKSFE